MGRKRLAYRGESRKGLHETHSLFDGGCGLSLKIGW
jgi:hypothetical protein